MTPLSPRSMAEGSIKMSPARFCKQGFNVKAQVAASLTREVQPVISIYQLRGE